MMQPREDNSSEEIRETAGEEVREETAADGGESTDAPSPADEAVEAEEAPEPTVEERLQAERDQFEEKWLRAVAEMENVRKRSRREVTDSRRFAQADMLRAFLGVLDNIERALGHDPGEEAGNGFRSGVELVFQQYRDVLKEYGVKAIEAMGAEFDPTHHEAVGQLEREGAEPGEIIEVVQQGYMFGDMVLRPARVIIASQG